MNQPCKASRCNEQFHCGRCGLQWDIDDTDPPKCMTVKEYNAKRMRELKDQVNERT